MKSQKSITARQPWYQEKNGAPGIAGYEATNEYLLE
jgi:hypothetical protein